MMTKKIGRIVAFGLALCLVALTIGSNEVYASENISLPESKLESINNDSSGDASVNADMMHYYTLKNKVYISKSKSIVEYLTTAWAKSDNYTVTKTDTYSASLTVTATSGTFTSSKIKEAGVTGSISRSYSVGTSIPADPSKNSKLTVQVEKYKYSADLYYVITNGVGYTSESKQGSGYYYEPKDMYLVVVYQ